MKSVWVRLTDQLDRLPSGCGLPLMLAAGVLFWVVALALVQSLV